MPYSSKIENPHEKSYVASSLNILIYIYLVNFLSFCWPVTHPNIMRQSGDMKLVTFCIAITSFIMAVFLRQRIKESFLQRFILVNIFKII